MTEWQPGGESGKSYERRLAEGFYDRWLGGEVILDVGFGGSRVLPRAIGIDLGYPGGYDGIQLPFADETIEAVYSSHMLEHTPDPAPVIRDWHRVLKVGGFIVCIVPHQFLYEKRRYLPSRFDPDHRRFYTPARGRGRTGPEQLPGAAPSGTLLTLRTH